MNQEELEKLKMDIIRLYGKNRGKKEIALYKSVLKLISYTEELKYTIKQIRNIGSKHYL